MSKRKLIQWKNYSFILLGIVFASTTIDVEAVEYPIDSGDVLSISVRNVGKVEFVLQSVKVPDSGIITIPLIGDIQVKNRRTGELEDLLTARYLNGYLRKPEVIVNVINYRNLFIHGAVKSPGAFDYQDDLTVEMVIALAGGSLENALIAETTVTRKGETKKAGNLRSPIQPGDIINVPYGEDPISKVTQSTKAEKEYFYMSGEVRTAGSFVYRDRLTVEKAIALAGGFGPRASKKKISIRREGEPPIILNRVPLDQTILPGDVITVGQSFF